RVVTHPLRIAVDVVDRAGELVGTGLCHRVHDRAGGTGDGDVVVGQVDVDRLDGVDRHRLAQGREVAGLQAEGVAGVHTVDADGIEARVLAASGQLQTVLVGLHHTRIQARDILQVALDGR